MHEKREGGGREIGREKERTRGERERGEVSEEEGGKVKGRRGSRDDRTHGRVMMRTFPLRSLSRPLVSLLPSFGAVASLVTTRAQVRCAPRRIQTWAKSHELY